MAIEKEHKKEILEIEETKEELKPVEEEMVEQEYYEELPQYLQEWEPKTELGRKVKAGEITHIDQILEEGLTILEPEIVDMLLNLKVELLNVGQAKGKFGGGKRRVFKQTQKKSGEGNIPKFSTMAAVGNEDGYVGIGRGVSKDTVPTRDKAIRNAKLNIFKIRRGCGSWECSCHEAHSIPFKVTGRCGSVRIELLPAPKGKGIVAEKEVAKVLRLAGIKDVWCNVKGQTRRKINVMYALEKALRKLTQIKVKPQHIEALNIKE